jgi:hypothetical protein
MLRGFRMRGARRWLAALMILGFTSAQAISLAHACGAAAGSSPAAEAAMIGTAVAMPADCPIMADGASHADTACDAHCLPREQVDQGADVRIAALAPPSPLIVQIVQPAIPASMRTAPPLVRIASPPLSLRFGRFLA